ncbi:MAG: hypothetical protein AVDCRST_MAG74-2156 [uncultured Pyrinomonadaceae bacterium]|uniref:Uncharacterized protein n=1 Tax=uncultured Pyrinomonadaceae bacterium TaxID=2283094 RepID=A0A6J4PCE4_9BACT|nr:MAG: hypothetical protein AVDCRST_MAG74-2156 [uncultured Pyrinomonadaceae bacterium]
MSIYRRKQFHSVNLETFTANNLINHFKLNETSDFIETSAKSGFKSRRAWLFLTRLTNSEGQLKERSEGSQAQ